ncbi:MAG: helix-turn-helix domain-containing protein [Cyanomargarita calcarea GSE-NOS-MK-12-04C]|jgi:excisionase family DNA binding protein|uniref:Helix-turn-helix domain-containing protein n=1 Tax=Cyanomargarita calcarea GSE-NOS-MK-12-04C TaxID=2839659 RepID=A0A951QIS6_9CYAN|nr:helix-turn-helix domain-containing protein [Cyanomargarita calcarea GSE-NOS-MK-12-04C]
MTTSLNQNIEQTIPTDKDVAVAKIGSQILVSYLQKNYADTSFRLISNGTEGEIVTIPTAALSLLVEILIQMADGNTVSIIPLKKELTTQEAADILQVSRPYLVQLLESGEIPYRKVGTRRRILTQDIINYKNRIDAARSQTLAELSAQAQELNMGY